MDIKEKKRGDSPEGLSFLNQLIISLEESTLKLEQAYKKENYEQLKAIKEFILKMQVKIADEIK